MNQAITNAIFSISSRPNAFPANSNGAPRNVNISPRVTNAAGQRIFSRLNARNARPLTSLPTQDGIYLWIIAFNPGNINQYSTRFVKVNPYFEFGSKHFMIRNRRPNMVIIGAGEMEKIGSLVRFNLLSGTYQASINQGLRALGLTDAQIHDYYSRMVPYVLGIPAQFTTDPIVDRLIIQQFTRRNLNVAGVAYQNIPYSATRWLKSEITTRSWWTHGSIGKKVGSRSKWGIVFRLDNHPNLLVKVTLLPMKTNATAASELHANEVRGLRKARLVDVTKVDLISEGIFTIPDNPILGQIFSAYSTGHNQTLSVIVMTDFFYPPANFTEYGDYTQFLSRHPELAALSCEQIRNYMRLLHSVGVRHGDLHPGNILYRKNVSDSLYTFSFIDFGASVKDKTLTNGAITKSGDPSFNTIRNLNGRSVTRVSFINSTVPYIYRTPDSWYLEYYYSKV